MSLRWALFFVFFRQPVTMRLRDPPLPFPFPSFFCFENDLISYASDANCGKSLEHTCFRVETQLNRKNIISYDLNPRTTWKLELHTNGQDLVSLLAARCTSCSIPARYGDARIERAT